MEAESTVGRPHGTCHNHLKERHEDLRDSLLWGLSPHMCTGRHLPAWSTLHKQQAIQDAYMHGSAAHMCTCVCTWMKLTLQGCTHGDTHAGTYIRAHMYTIEGH